MAKSKKYMDSERYRQMLVKDGERRFQEWHSSFLKYQKNFLQDTAAVKYVETADADDQADQEPADTAEPTDPFGIFS